MSKPAPSTMRPTEVDETILAAINRLGGYLTAGQLSRLLYPKAKDRDRYSQRRLARLVQGGFLLRLRALRRPQFGSVPHVFTLTHTGRRYLAGRGYPVEPYYRPAEEHAKAANYLFMEHTLAVIDVLIAAERLVAQSGAAGGVPIRMPRLATERRLKREAVSVAVSAVSAGGSAQRTVVIPDAWWQLQVGQAAPISIALELDRGHVEQKRWRRKVAALCAWAEGPYRQAFATDNLTVAVITPDEARCDQLREWTGRELAERTLTELADIFLFTSADPVTTPPQALFFDPLWQPVGDLPPLSLLDTPGPAVTQLGSQRRGEAVVVRL